MRRKLFIVLLSLAMVFGVMGTAFAKLTAEQALGKRLYFDRYLSLNHNQSCASCHDPNHGFADPINVRFPATQPTSVGSDNTLFGGRNAPPAAYAMYSPPFAFDPVAGLYTGGQFWDGRAATLKDQAMGPFLNPVEMANPSKTAVIANLKDPANPNSPYYRRLFLFTYGLDLRGIDTTLPEAPGGPSLQVELAYDLLAQAIGAYETFPADFAQFSSKFDAVQAGALNFTAQEQRGFDLFNGAAQCNLCHPAPLFTDFTYDNLGIPANPALAGQPIDLGLGGVLVDPAEDGKFKVSSLRNLTLTAPYGHNGFFATLEDIVHFYNTRDVPAENWPAPEVAANVNTVELGNLGLTLAQEADLVAFLKTLTDLPVGRSYPPAGFP